MTPLEAVARVVCLAAPVAAGWLVSRRANKPFAVAAACVALGAVAFVPAYFVEAFLKRWSGLDDAPRSADIVPLIYALLVAAPLEQGAKFAAFAPIFRTRREVTPLDGVIYGFLLTDGSLLFQGGLLQDFYRFKPDSKGSYVNGTLFPTAALPPNYIPYATSGGVLPDGRVLLIGGEYELLSNNTLTFSFTNKMVIYDPNAEATTKVSRDNRRRLRTRILQLS